MAYREIRSATSVTPDPTVLLVLVSEDGGDLHRPLDRAGAAR